VRSKADIVSLIYCTVPYTEKK